MKESDSGTYECMVDNQFDTATDRIRLRVEPKLEDLEPPKLPKASIFKTNEVRIIRKGSEKKSKRLNICDNYVIGCNFCLFVCLF